MTTIRCETVDPRDLIDLLIQAVEITSATGNRPSIHFGGKLFQPYELLKIAALLPADEELLDRHQSKVDAMFKAPQRGYMRTGYNLAHRANQIESERKMLVTGRAIRGVEKLRGLTRG